MNLSPTVHSVNFCAFEVVRVLSVICRRVRTVHTFQSEKELLRKVARDSEKKVKGVRWLRLTYNAQNIFRLGFLLLNSFLSTTVGKPATTKQKNSANVCHDQESNPSFGSGSESESHPEDDGDGDWVEYIYSSTEEVESKMQTFKIGRWVDTRRKL